MENNKKLILILVAIVLIVAIATFFLVRTFSKPDSGNENSNSTTITNDNQQPDDPGGSGSVPSGYYARRNGEFIHLLEGLNEEDLAALRETKDYLMSNKMYKICLQIANANEQNECLDKLKTYQINQLGRPELCQQLDNEQDNCFLNAAVAKYDIDICDEIDSDTIKNECKDTLIYKTAWESGDVAVCYQASNDDERLRCIERVMQEQTDLDNCDDNIITSNDLTELCQSYVLLNQVDIKKLF